MSEPAPPSTVERQAPRWMRILLIVSLGLNLLTVGLIASAAWHIRQAGGFVIHGRLSTFVDNLPAERAAVLRSIVDDRRSSVRPLRQEAREKRREATELFIADSFDKEKYAAAQDRLLEAELRVRRAHLKVLTEVASQMTVDERRAYLKWREQGWRRGPSKGDRDAGAQNQLPAERKTP